MIDLAVSKLYYYMGAFESAPTGSWPSQSYVDNTVWSLYQSLNATSGFQNLLTSKQAANFTMDLEYRNATGIQNTSFGFHWNQSGSSSPSASTNASPATASFFEENEYWLANVTASSLAGPFFYNTSIQEGTGLSQETGYWEGWEFAPHATINSTYSLDIVDYWGAPPQNPTPPGSPVDPQVFSWTGLSSQPNGQGELIQTGYNWDACYNSMRHCYHYGFIPGILTWENYPGFTVPILPLIQAAPSSALTEAILRVGNCLPGGLQLWMPFDFDYTGYAGYGGAGITYTNCGFTPEYTQGITETPWESGSGFQQIPQPTLGLAGTLVVREWPWSIPVMPRGSVSVATMMTNGWWTSDYMNQNCFIPPNSFGPQVYYSPDIFDAYWNDSVYVYPCEV